MQIGLVVSGGPVSLVRIATLCPAFNNLVGAIPNAPLALITLPSRA
jgi:hypothetical protein